MRRLVVLAIALAWPAALAAQASIFGVRGPGTPARPYSARADATGGSFALFDGESALGEGSLGYVNTAAGTFTVVTDFRHTSTPAGEANVQTTRFPQIMVATPLKNSRWVVGLSASLYTDRDYAIVTVDTTQIFDEQVISVDSLTSRGSLSDFRLAVAYRGLPRTTVGLGFHFITGAARQSVGRIFVNDSSFTGLVQRAEVAASGVGLSLGGTRLVSQRLTVGGVIRKDFRASVDVDSVDQGSFALPWTFAGGVKYAVGGQLNVASQVLYRTWSSIDSFLVANGAPGSGNTLDLSLGAEYVKNPLRPGNLPLRLGVRYATLPYRTSAGGQPTEFAVTAGSALRFAKDKAGFDVTIDKVWRKDDEDRSESAWLLYVGFSIRP